MRAGKTNKWITNESNENRYRQRRQWHEQKAERQKKNNQTSFINNCVRVQNNWRKVVAMLTEPCGGKGHGGGNTASYSSVGSNGGFCCQKQWQPFHLHYRYTLQQQHE